jgi:exopolyphosphatase/guanosine-5'-triphosphate,3'-diphosphate pyrophosphatase
MKAVIDLGTNTFNLLIGDIKKKEKGILVSLEEPVMLGKGGIQDNLIMPEAFERAFNVLEKFKTVLNQYQIKSISAFATSAIRNAKNGNDFIQQVDEKFQIQIESISGDLEAEYIYYGVRNSFDFQDENYLIMDIGGGSVEFIIGNKEQYYWKQSFEVGAIRLHEKFKKHDPILSIEINEIKQYLFEKLAPLFDQINLYPIKGLIGSAGTFESMWQILEGDFSSNCVSVSPYAKKVDELNLNRFLEFIIQSNLEERKQLQNLVDFRREYIVVACVLIEFIIHNTQIKELICSDFALKEGVYFHS